MSYVVTGGAGFIGSAFLARLNAAGVTDIIVVDHLGTGDKWKNLRGKRFADYLDKGEFIARIEKGSAPSGIEAIIHLGACSSTTERDADYLMRNNFYYSTALATFAFRNKTRFIYASSAATYGDGSLGYSDDHEMIAKLRPMNGYGFSKNLFDSWALDRGILDQAVGLRFFNVYGPNEYHKGDQSSVVYKAWKSIKETGAMKLFKSNSAAFKDGEQKRDFIYVKDCCEVMWKTLQNRSINGVFNLGTGNARTWLDLARAVFKALGVQEKIEFIPMPDSLSKHYQNFTEAKMEKLIAAGGFASGHSLEDGIKDYVVNYLEKPEQYL